MHEREVSAGDSVDYQKKTVWYGVGKAVEKGARALGPESWRKRILHIIDTQIIPRSNPKWQEWAKTHRQELENVAAVAGVSITVAEISLVSVAVLWGAKRFRKLLEQSRLNKKLEKRWGKYAPYSFVDKVAWVKNSPSELSFFKAQIFGKFSEKFGIKTAGYLSDTMTTLVSYKDIFTERNTWNRIVSLANAGKVAAALGLLEHIFQEGFTSAGYKHGWAKEIPNEYKKFYVSKMLLPLWLETPQIEEIVSSGERKRKHSVNDVMDAFARIRDHMQTPNYLRSYRNQTRQFLRNQSRKDINVSSKILIAIRALRKYQLQPASREGVVTDSLPASLINEATLGQYQSMSPAWLDEFQQKLAGVPEGVSAESSPKEQYLKITYDRKYQDLLLKDRSRPVKFKTPKTVLERIRRVLKGKKDPQQIREPYVGEEDVVLSVKRSTKDYIYNTAKTEDNSVQLLKPEKKFMEPESIIERLQREQIQNAHFRATKRKKKAIEKARKEYREKHPPKSS